MVEEGRVVVVAHLLVVIITTMVQEAIEAMVMEVEDQDGSQEEMDEAINLQMILLVQATLVLFTQV